MILCENTYFGQDEILENSKRVSKAQVFSQICQLYRIQKTVDFFDFLLIYFKKKFMENVKSKSCLESLSGDYLNQTALVNQNLETFKNLTTASEIKNKKIMFKKY